MFCGNGNGNDLRSLDLRPCIPEEDSIVAGVDDVAVAAVDDGVLVVVVVVVQIVVFVALSVSG